MRPASQTKTGNVYFANSTSYYAYQDDSGNVYYTIDGSTWYQKLENMVLLPGFDGTKPDGTPLDKYFNSTMDPQSQVGAAFGSGNEYALSGQDEDDYALNDALAGEDNGKSASDIAGNGYGDYGQDTSGSGYVRKSSVMQLASDASVALTVYEYTDANGNIIWLHETLDENGNVTGQSWYTASDDKLTPASVPVNANAVYTISTYTDKGGTVYDVYQNANGEKLYKKGDQWYSMDAQGNATSASPTDPSVYTPVYMGKTVEADTDTGDVDGMDEDTYNDTVSDTTPSSSSFETASKDGTSAIVQSGSALDAHADINVLAGDVLNANLIGGTLAIGGTAGVGVGLAVMVLFSDVYATVTDGSTLRAGGDITVEAKSGSNTKPVLNNIDTLTDSDGVKYVHYKGADNNDYYVSQDNGKLYTISGGTATESNYEGKLTLVTTGDEGDERGEDASIINEIANSKTNSGDSSTIRLIGVTAAGGTVGVAITLGALFVFSNVSATLEGDVLDADAVNVNAEMNYGEVLAVTVGIGAARSA